jgi:hypothetical protein
VGEDLEEELEREGLEGGRGVGWLHFVNCVGLYTL